MDDVVFEVAGGDDFVCLDFCFLQVGVAFFAIQFLPFVGLLVIEGDDQSEIHVSVVPNLNFKSVLVYEIAILSVSPS